MKTLKQLSVFAACLTACCFALMTGCSGTPSSGGGGGGGGTGGGDETVDWVISDDSWTHSNKIKYVRDMGFATGAEAFVDTTPYNMTGTDLGFAFFDEEIGRLYVAFGDTDDRSSGRREWNSNCILYTDNLDFTNGIMWEGALEGQNGASRTVTPLTASVVNTNLGIFWDEAQVGDVTSAAVSTCIPTGALVLDGTYYMWYMEVGSFEATGEWDVYRNCVVKSKDKGLTWTKIPGLEWVVKDANEEEGDAPNFGQIYPLDGGDGYVYLYGLPGGRSGGIKLARVSYAQIENFESYEYYKKTNDDGSVDWRAGTNGLRSIKADTNSYIVMPMCGEVSVCWNAYMNRYVMTYMQNNSQIVMRRSTTPWGEWSSSDAIVTQGDISTLYGGLSHSAMMTHGGQRMYLFVSVWYPTYNVKLVEVVLN